MMKNLFYQALKRPQPESTDQNDKEYRQNK